MTEAEKEALFNKKYKEWHEHLVSWQNNYDANARLSYEKRLELEKKVADLVDFCNENGICMHSPNDIAQLKINLKGNGSRELDYHGLSICTAESCYASVHCDETSEELEAHARKLAQSDVEYAVLSEKEAEEKKKREAEEMEAGRKAYEEACKSQNRRIRQQVLDDLDELRKEGCPHVGPKINWEDQDAEEHKQQKVDLVNAAINGTRTEAERFANSLVEKITAYDSRYEDIEDMPFDYSNVAEEQIAAVDNYVLQCVRFADAMDMGLSGVGLYTFNNDRANAHYMMLAAFGLENDEAVLCATKDYDYATVYDVKKGKHIPKGKLVSRELLCWILWKCAKRNKEKKI